MTSRFLSRHNVIAVFVLVAIALGAWLVLHTKHAAEVTELRAHVPDGLVTTKVLVTCNESDLWAIDRRAVFSVSLQEKRSFSHLARDGNHWIEGPIPESAFYNDSTTFICPSIAPALKDRILAASRNPRNLSQDGEYSVFWLPSQGLLVVRRYNN